MSTPGPTALSEAIERVTAWLDDDEGLRIPGTEWGYALYDSLRLILAAAGVGPGGAADEGLRQRIEALADECSQSGCIHLNDLWGRLRAALDATPAPTEDEGDWTFDPNAPHACQPPGGFGRAPTEGRTDSEDVVERAVKHRWPCAWFYTLQPTWANVACTCGALADGATEGQGGERA